MSKTAVLSYINQLLNGVMKMKKWKKWVAAGVILLVVMGGAFWALAGREPAPTQSLNISKEAFVQVITATGRLVPARTLQVQSQVTGRLLTLPFNEGDGVQAGDILATLDDGDARQRVTESRSSLTLAQARARSLAELAVPMTREELQRLSLEREQLERTLQRQEVLYDQGAIPLEPLEETRNALSLLESRIRTAEVSLAARQPGGSEAAEVNATIAQARSSVDTLVKELEKYTLKAPFDARVLERLVEPGELIQPGTVLLVLAGDEGFFAEVELDERSMGLIQVGQPARLWPEAFPSREVKAQVSAIAPRVNADTGTVQVRLSLEEQADFLIQDLTIQAEVEVRSLESAVLLPVSYLWQNDPARVLVAVEGVAAERMLTVESVSLNQVLVLEGLSDGDVVIDPQAGLSPGDAVRILPAGEGGGSS